MLAWLSPSQTYFQLQTACLLPQIPPRRTESSKGCRNRRRGVRGDNVWTGTHRQQLQKGSVSDPPDAATVVHELAHPVVLFPRLLAFLLFRLVPHFCPRWVSAAACHCVRVCIRRCVCVCALDWWCSRQSCSLGSEKASSEFSSVRPHQLLSIFNQQVRTD